MSLKSIYLTPPISLRIASRYSISVSVMSRNDKNQRWSSCARISNYIYGWLSGRPVKCPCPAILKVFLRTPIVYTGPQHKSVSKKACNPVCAWCGVWNVDLQGSCKFTLCFAIFPLYLLSSSLVLAWTFFTSSIAFVNVCVSPSDNGASFHATFNFITSAKCDHDLRLCVGLCAE